MLLLNPDYIGWYYPSQEEASKEILMADSLRYKGTSSELTININDSFFDIYFECSAEVRPDKTKTLKKRLDIYINLSYFPQLMDYFTRNGIQEAIYVEGTNSSNYNEGNVSIPIEQPGPKLDAKNLEIESQRWIVSLENYDIYTDIEMDKDRDTQLQLHLGIPVEIGRKKRKNVMQNVGGPVKLTGKFEIPIASINKLYSFLSDYVQSP